MPSSLAFHPEVSAAASRSIVISGCARSGTTLLGKILATCKSVEYFFEPESLNGLFALADSTQLSAYKALYTSLLVEHLCFGSMAGRNINLNTNDDSSISKSKSSREIQYRLSHGWRRKDLLQLLPSITPIFKLPSIIPALLFHHFSAFPSSKAICVIRDPLSIYLSIQKKGWFNLSGDLLSPFLLSQLPELVPYWVPRQFAESWNSLSEIEKFHHYYSTVYSAAELSHKSFIFVDYSQLVSAPEALLSKLFDRLEISPGELTQQVIDTIYERPVEENDSQITNALAPLQKQYERLLAYSI